MVRGKEHRVLMRRPEGKRPLGRLGLDGWIILKLIFKNWNGETRTGLIWLRIGTGDWHL